MSISWGLMISRLVITGCKERQKIQNAMQLLAGTLESTWTFRSSTFGLSSPRLLAGRKADRCQDRKSKVEIKSSDRCCRMVSEQHIKQGLPLRPPSNKRAVMHSILRE